jgi:hypothetical protein
VAKSRKSGDGRDDDHGSRVESAGVAEGVEQKVIEFAEQLGWLVGTVQAKSEGWLDRKALNAQVGRIRDSATNLMAQLGRDPQSSQGSRQAAKAAGSKKALKRAPKALAADRGPVDGPGKRHRPAPPSTRGVKHSDERIAKETLAHRLSRRPRS